MNLYNHTTGCGLLLLVLLLSACAPVKDVINPYNEDFKCRAKDDAGKCIDTPTAYKEARYPEAKEGQPEPGDVAKQATLDKRYKVLAELLEEPKKPVLQPPKILRVLLLPYQGEQEELFMTRFVYVQIEDSRWVLTDLAEK
ncbi:MAG: TraV family lipoprotein [Desulfobulbaceae bacterium]